MTLEGNIGSKSLIDDEPAMIENDPLEAIFALNLGDFLTEHLISNDLMSKINTSVHDKITRLKNQLKELISIYSLDKTLTILGFDSEDDFVIYNSIAKTITQMLEVSACHVYLNPEYIHGIKKIENADLLLMGSSLDDIDKNLLKKSSFSLKDSKNLIVKSFLTCKTNYIKKSPRSKHCISCSNINSEEVVTVLTVPMANSYDNVGVICIENYSQKDIAPEQIKLIEITAKLFVTSMRLQKLMEESDIVINDSSATPSELMHLRTELTASIGDLGDEQQLFVESLAKAVDIKSQYTGDHSNKVANLAKDIADYLKLNEKTTDLIYYAGLLQNIGKITLPEEIFSQKGKLSKDDWNKLQNHPNVGVSLLMKINFLSEVVPYIHYHRERWNGQGEPEGLAGMSIPLGSRIIAVADAYQAMVSERAYRESMSEEKVLEVLKSEAGIKWDPVIVDALIEIKQNPQ
jgi:HD-GYP domain-containing protein (c-di-GMP phosphodiesterase class II)